MESDPLTPEQLAALEEYQDSLFMTLGLPAGIISLVLAAGAVGIAYGSEIFGFFEKLF